MWSINAPRMLTWNLSYKKKLLVVRLGYYWLVAFHIRCVYFLVFCKAHLQKALSITPYLNKGWLKKTTTTTIMITTYVLFLTTITTAVLWLMLDIIIVNSHVTLPSQVEVGDAAFERVFPQEHRVWVWTEGAWGYLPSHILVIYPQRDTVGQHGTVLIYSICVSGYQSV